MSGAHCDQEHGEDAGEPAGQQVLRGRDGEEPDQGADKSESQQQDYSTLFSYMCQSMPVIEVMLNDGDIGGRSPIDHRETICRLYI